MAVDTSLPVGSTIPGTVRYYTLNGSCPLTPPYVVAGAPIISCYYGSGSEVMPGVYSTGIAGIGIRLRNAAGQPMTNAAGVTCDTRAANLGVLNPDLTYSVSVSVEFVKTGPIGTGTLDLDQTRFGFGVFAGKAAGALGSGNGNTIGFTGTASPREIACNISYPPVVTLPNVSAATLATQGAAGNTPFSIQVTCSGSAVVGMTLDGAGGTPVQSAPNGILGIANAGSGGRASGAGVQIVNASGSAPVPLQVRNAMGNIAPNVAAIYRFGARYVALGGTPSPGTVSSAMVFTLDYQ
ncbi:fimbrial protein [Cupriavidus oxalaticus]|nr:fimbrial protein [Cupriavidus oxalaticus]